MESSLLSKNWIAFMAWLGYGLFIGSVNRFLTLYITFTRARLVWSLRQAQKSLKKSEKDHIRETVFLGIIPGVLLGVAFCIPYALRIAAFSSGNQLVSQFTPTPRSRRMAFKLFLGFLGLILVMVSLPCYILWKTRRLNIRRVP
jgi:uncharacterized membrane protein